MSVPALRAGTLRKVIFKMPGKVNSPTPRGCIEPNITDSSVLKTPTAVLRGRSFCSAIRLISADLVSVCLITRADVTGLPGFCLAIISPGVEPDSKNEVVFQATQMLIAQRDALQQSKPASSLKGANRPRPVSLLLTLAIEKGGHTPATAQVSQKRRTAAKA